MVVDCTSTKCFFVLCRLKIFMMKNQLHILWLLWFIRTDHIWLLRWQLFSEMPGVKMLFWPALYLGVNPKEASRSYAEQLKTCPSGTGCLVMTVSRNVPAHHRCTFRGSLTSWHVKKKWWNWWLVTFVLMDCGQLVQVYQLFVSCLLFCTIYKCLISFYQQYIVTTNLSWKYIQIQKSQILVTLKLA